MCAWTFLATSLKAQRERFAIHHSSCATRIPIKSQKNNTHTHTHTHTHTYKATPPLSRLFFLQKISPESPAANTGWLSNSGDGSPLPNELLPGTDTTGGRDYLPFGYLFLIVQFSLMTLLGVLTCTFGPQLGWDDPAYFHLTAIMTSGP